jgi:hypothetical protein
MGEKCVTRYRGERGEGREEERGERGGKRK